MTFSWAQITAAVVARAQGRCEYCCMHQSLQGATFHVEHILPSSRGGLSELENLALSCPSCNFHKSKRVEAVDPESGELVALFHPRNHTWADHFQWAGVQLKARTAIGRATVAAFQLNQLRRVDIRRAEQLFSLFPPEL